MFRVTVVSFDMEGTLIDNGFSRQIWEVDIPNLYAEIHGLPAEEARRRVADEYAAVGEGKPEWYDVDYWWRRFSIPGDWRELPRKRKPYCRVYPDTRGVLNRLSQRYTLIVSSNTIREFLEVQLECVGHPFSRVFSAPSDFNGVNKSPDFYRRVLAEMDLEPDSLAHVGDHRQFDYVAPRELGVRAWHLDRSETSSGEDMVRSLEEFEARLQGG